MERNFSQRVKDVLGYSREEAERLQNSYIGPEHLLLGILRDGSGKAIEALRHLGVQLAELKASVEKDLRLSNDHINAGDEITISKSTDKVLKMSILEARILKSDTTDTEHLLLAILKDPDTPATRSLKDCDVTYQEVMEYFKMAKPLSDTPLMGAEFADDDDDEFSSH